MNERGACLVEQKETRKPKEVDVAWLKDFLAVKKQASRSLDLCRAQPQGVADH